ncbi:MAG: permease-like cell division protein FtsX [Synergistetes bacterium]|nr:permease-like cell division protein FtsX [Synergistota bacterium]MCX8127367.1 permease-like cell division protein FtsX [Synergistota bacterium]MDW8192231.1 permease-like cell division protein FtsX [Synergistota bacterium]
MYKLKYFLREALKGLWRHGFMSLLTVTTIFIVLFIVGLFLLVGINIRFAVESLSQSLEIRLVLKGNPTPQDVQRLYSSILSIEGVKEAKFVSRGEGLRNLAKELGREDLLSLLKTNPLPDVFEIRVKKASDIDSVVGIIKNWRETQEIIYGKEAAQKLLALQRLLVYSGSVLALILLVSALLVIFNTIRLVVYARREEIEIMKLVGATHWFIRLPFLFEGVILGGIGGIVASIGLFFVYREALDLVALNFPFIPLINDMTLIYKLCGFISLGGLLIGLGGGLFAVQRLLGKVAVE